MKHFKFICKLFLSLAFILIVSCVNTNSKNIQIKKDGMIFIQGGKFLMGGDNDEARDDEYPKHSVCLLYTSPSPRDRG